MCSCSCCYSRYPSKLFEDVLYCFLYIESNKEHQKELDSYYYHHTLPYRVLSSRDACIQWLDDNKQQPEPFAYSAEEAEQLAADYIDYTPIETHTPNNIGVNIESDAITQTLNNHKLKLNY